MREWRIESTKPFVVPERKLQVLDTLIQGVGGRVVIDEVRWDKTYAVHTSGYMETDSFRVANRILKLIHSCGGRIRLHAISDQVRHSRRKSGFHRSRIRVATRSIR